MWVCEALEVVKKGLQWKSWSDDGQTDRQTESILTYRVKTPYRGKTTLVHKFIDLQLPEFIYETHLCLMGTKPVSQNFFNKALFYIYGSWVE